MMNERTPEANCLHPNASDFETDQILADVQVCVTNSNGETKAVQPWITVVMDRSTGECVHLGVSAKRPTIPVPLPNPLSPAVTGRIERWFRKLHRHLKSELGFGSTPPVDPRGLPTLKELNSWVSGYVDRRLERSG